MKPTISPFFGIAASLLPAGSTSAVTRIETGDAGRSLLSSLNRAATMALAGQPLGNEPANFANQLLFKLTATTTTLRGSAVNRQPPGTTSNHQQYEINSTG